jgi:hypothetical protein
MLDSDTLFEINKPDLCFFEESANVRRFQRPKRCSVFRLPVGEESLSLSSTNVLILVTSAAVPSAGPALGCRRLAQWVQGSTTETLRPGLGVPRFVNFS